MDKRSLVIQEAAVCNRTKFSQLASLEWWEIGAVLAQHAQSDFVYVSVHKYTPGTLIRSISQMKEPDEECTEIETLTEVAGVFSTLHFVPLPQLASTSTRCQMIGHTAGPGPSTIM